MKYSKKLKSMIKKQFGENSKEFYLIKKNNHMVGRLLDDQVITAIPVKEIKEAKSLKELNDKLKENEKIKTLYSMWGKEYIKWQKGMRNGKK